MQFIVLCNLQESGLSRVSTTFPQITKKNTNWRHNSLAGTDHWNSKLTKYILCEKDNYSVFLIFHNTIFSEYLELNNQKLMLIPLKCLFCVLLDGERVIEDLLEKKFYTWLELRENFGWFLQNCIFRYFLTRSIRWIFDLIFFSFLDNNYDI